MKMEMEMEWKYGNGNGNGNGNMEIGNMEICKYGNMGIWWKYKNMKI
jgi:hypothetical protein